MKTTTIFKQLILNVIIPVVVALIILGGLNYYNTKKLLDEFNESENKAITEEIYQYLSLQDLALEVIEIDLDERMKYLSSILVEQFEKNLDSIEAINLEKIGREIGLNLETEDIYIINKHGIVVNTTFTKDLHLDFFSFGEEHKNMLLGVLSDSVFKSERFAIENTTRRIKKYSYQPTKNGEYIIELGVYSHKADEINNKVRNTIESISGLHKSIVSVGLFMGSDNPFSLNKDVDLCDYQRQIIINQLKSEKDTSFRRIDGDVVYNYDYLYMDRDNTDLYKNAVIRIVSDRSEQKKYLLFELIKLLLIFLVTIFAVAYIIYQKTKIITTPIKRLVENVTRIAGGNFNERALVEGNNEVAKLSAHFNYMLEKIEEYYKELEQKVEERTHEVVQQKEEIETQRDDLAQKNEHLELAYSKIEAQNKHITDSINYAQRIQRAILPPEILINSIIPDSFIYYKPKDIVSGDFYWMSHSESVDLIAAVDCTGHSVPGAFMSIIGKENLNHVVNVRKNTEPNIILNTLNERITNALNQNAGCNKVKDGMDIALCAIDKENKTICFSGANNPLYYIHNGELEIIKGNRFPVGAYIDEELQEFTNHRFKYVEGDFIYLFSDGYADQFGGEYGKKYMSKNFKNLIMSIYSKPMQIQKEILEEEFVRWKGEEEQIDDVLVIGIRL